MNASIDYVFKREQGTIYRPVPPLTSLDRTNAPRRLNRFLSSYRSSFLHSLPVSPVNDTPPEPLTSPIAVSSLPFATTNRPPLSLLHLEMSDDLWYNVTMQMAQYYLQVTGKDLTTETTNNVYCTNPPKEGPCLNGICPNPDIAGTVLRISRKFSLSFLSRMVI